MSPKLKTETLFLDTKSKVILHLHGHVTFTTNPIAGVRQYPNPSLGKRPLGAVGASVGSQSSNLSGPQWVCAIRERPEPGLNLEKVLVLVPSRGKKKSPRAGHVGPKRRPVLCCNPFKLDGRQAR